MGILRTFQVLRNGVRKSGGRGQDIGYGMHILELITRARTRLCIILMRDDDDYENTKKYFQQAADLGLIDMEAVEISQGDHETDVDEEEGEVEDEVDVNSKGKISCMSGCCIS